MDFFWVNILICLLVFFVILFGVLKYSSVLRFENSENTKLVSGSKDLNNALSAKADIEFHLSWAKHSGDYVRISQLQEELAKVEMEITSIKL